ncbi:SHOCT domain-containing protein [Mycobacterium sp. TJFP1]
MIVGVAFIFIGVSMVIPEFGSFGVLWTLVALGITVYSAINVFTARGVAQEVVEFDSPTQWHGAPRGESIEARLRELEELRGRGVLSEAEYQQQRNRILTEL